MMMKMKAVLVGILLLIICFSGSSSTPGHPKTDCYAFCYEKDGVIPPFTPTIPDQSTPSPPPTSGNLPSLPDIKAVNDCFKDVFGLPSCLQDLFVSLLSRRIALKADCCNSIQQLSQDCFSSLFAAFVNAAFGATVSQYCSTTPPPGAPAPALPIPEA